MFDKLPGVIPLEILPELNELAREFEQKFKKKEFIGESGAGIVKVVVHHPGKIAKVEIEERYFNPENKKLVEDLIPSAIERALDTMTEQYKDMMTEASTRIQEIVSRFTESKKTGEPTSSDDENLN